MRKAVGSSQWAAGSEASMCGSSAFSADRVRLFDGLSGAGTSLPTADCRLSTDKGVILIALLWILTALSVIALSFSKESRVEVSAARNSQSMEAAYYAARAGIALTAYQLLRRQLLPPVQSAISQDTVDPLDLGVVTGNIGSATYRVDIQDESGKIFLNQVREAQLRLLVEACGIPKPDSDIITDSILDWLSPPSAQPRTNGAKDNYYQSLNLPYKAKNGNFSTIEELLLVRGVTPDYFYGHSERAQDGSIVFKYGLSRCFTLYLTGRYQGQINVNYAPLPVLLSTGISPPAAQAICDRRRTKPFKDIIELQREIPSLGTVSNLGVGSTGVYTLTASAHAENSKAQRVIRTVISLVQGPRTQYLTLYWNENIPNYEGYLP
jgi:general secretion pathway protein K